MAAKATIRPIETRDDARVAEIIRTVMPEFGAVGPGYALGDPEVDGMTAAYSGSRARYFVADVAGVVVGGAGVAQLRGRDARTAELRKMYLVSEARGAGAGRALLRCCIAVAVAFDFTTLYLETLPHMTTARALYESEGFRLLDEPLGDTGHHACDVHYALDLGALDLGAIDLGALDLGALGLGSVDIGKRDLGERT